MDAFSISNQPFVALCLDPGSWILDREFLCQCEDNPTVEPTWRTRYTFERTICFVLILRHRLSPTATLVACFHRGR